MKAIIYVRVSTEEQVHGGSLVAQETDCTAWCGRNGYQVVEVYRDEGESAKTADRPGLLAAVDRVKRGGVDALIVHKLDRLARNATDGLAIRAELRRHNCKLLSATEGAGDDPVGEMVGTVLLAVAQFDNAVRAQRCRRGMTQVALAGGWSHKAPIGYCRARQGNLPILAHDPNTAPTITEALTGLAEGRISRTEFTEAMRPLGVTKQRCAQILAQPVYGGIVQSPLTGGEPIRAAFPGLVTPETWAKVQEVLPLSDRDPKGRYREELPMAGVVRCGVCGRRMVGALCRSRTGRRYGYYWCSDKHARVRADHAHQQLGGILGQDRSGAVMDLKSIVVAEAAAEAEEGARERDAAAARLRQIETRYARLVDGYADGTIDGEMYRRKASEYRAAMADARQACQDAQAGMDGVLNAIDAIVELMADPAELWGRLNNKNRKKMADLLLGGLTIAADGTLAAAGFNPDKFGGR